MNTEYQTILGYLDNVDPKRYGRTRNFIEGAVTRLSPYISRGVLSTKQVLASILDRGIDPLSVEKFVQELAWRDYWQRLGIAHGEAIFEDLKQPPTDRRGGGLPVAIIEGNTGIEGIDKEIHSFYETGYMHNHVRMYVAGLVCNISKCDWKQGAQWMYYHLLDADWASNYLSWQWVAGTSRNRQ